MSDPVTPPDLSQPLINEPVQANPPANIDGMGPLQHLLGTWTNQNLGGTTAGGTASPYSYNLMPLPTTSVPAKYILKNFTYYEEITFSAIHGTAPNRGGDYTQTANVLFYEQRVYFADGPDKDKLVHAENGSWLFLNTGEQQEGPYAATPIVIPHPDPIPAQPITTNVAKQISVPHGNSILVQGGIEGFPDNYVQNGPLTIGDYENAIPIGVDTEPYATESVGNPLPELNNNPNKPLQEGALASPCTQYIQWTVDSKNQDAPGHVTNIPFELQKANVIDYNANYWLQALNNSGEYNQLAYNQTIFLNIPINGGTVSFPHVTCNILTKKN